MRFKLGKEASGQDHNGSPAEGAGEGDHVFVFFSGGAQRYVTSLGKQRGMFPAKTERAAGYIEFQTAVRWLGDQPIDPRGQTPGLGSVKLLEQRLQPLVINRTAIVRVGEAKVPDFGSLVKIRQARSCDLQQSLRKRVENSGSRDPCLEGCELVEKQLAR